VVNPNKQLAGPEFVHEMTSSDVLKLHQVSMRFDGPPVLSSVSLSFQPGRIHGLVGHNGSGKSTLIRVLAGYYIPTEGTISLGGKPVVQGSPPTSFRLGLRFVHQSLGLIPEFNALENFGLGADYSLTRFNTIDWSDQRRRLQAALTVLERELPMNLPVAQFSPVERTLLAIARAIAVRADGGIARFLMLDEPTTTLERPETEQLFSVVRRLSDKGLAVLYVSHQFDDILELTQTVTVLRDGHVVETMETAGVTRERLVAAVLGDGSSTAAPNAPGPHGSSLSAAIHGSQPVLSISGLTSSRLRRASFAVGRGECVCAVGLSGSGREELVQAVAGAVSCSVDRIEVQGKHVATLNPRECRRRRIAIVLGNRIAGSIISKFSIQENLTFATLDEVTRAGIIEPSKEGAQAESWIDLFDIRPADPRYLSEHLSGGNKQKVILAKWLAINPIALLIDEPTAGVDIGVTKTILSMLRSLADQGKALLITTSEVSDVLAIADRVLVFSRGHLVATLAREKGELSERAIVQAMSAGWNANESSHDTESGWAEGRP
jgi:ribose transport system ATP-binding protein